MLSCRFFILLFLFVSQVKAQTTLDKLSKSYQNLTDTTSEKRNNSYYFSFGGGIADINRFTYLQNNYIECIYYSKHNLGTNISSGFHWVRKSSFEAGLILNFTLAKLDEGYSISNVYGNFQGYSGSKYIGNIYYQNIELFISKYIIKRKFEWSIGASARMHILNSFQGKVVYGRDGYNFNPGQEPEYVKFESERSYSYSDIHFVIFGANNTFGYNLNEQFQVFSRVNVNILQNHYNIKGINRFNTFNLGIKYSLIKETSNQKLQNQVE